MYYPRSFLKFILLGFLLVSLPLLYALAELILSLDRLASQSREEVIQSASAARTSRLLFEQTTTLEISKRPMLLVAPPVAERGAAVSYDRLLWTFLRMPCFPARGPDGERCMALVDTGLSGEIARVTADVAIRQGLPSRRKYPEFAWVPRFDLSEGVSLREFPAAIHPLRWEARLAGLPLDDADGAGLPAPDPDTAQDGGRS